jgi:hypothetical protein
LCRSDYPGVGRIRQAISAQRNRSLQQLWARRRAGERGSADHWLPACLIARLLKKHLAQQRAALLPK